MQLKPTALVAALFLGTGAAHATTFDLYHAHVASLTPTEVDGKAGTSYHGSFGGFVEILAISGLKGGETLDFSFTQPKGYHGYSYAAGAFVTPDHNPYGWRLTGKDFGKVKLGGHLGPQTFSLALGEKFKGGVSYVGLFASKGHADYKIDGLPGKHPSDIPAPVPLPAGAWLLATALGGLFLGRRFRNA